MLEEAEQADAQVVRFGLGLVDATLQQELDLANAQGVGIVEL